MPQVFVLTAGKLRQRILVLNGSAGQFNPLFVFTHGLVKDFLFFFAGFVAVDKIREVELGALPLEAHGVHHTGERVGGNAMNPRASIIDWDLVIPDISDVGASSDPIVRFQHQDRMAQVLQLPGGTNSRNPSSDDDYIVSAGCVIPGGRGAVRGRHLGCLDDLIRPAAWAA